MAPSSPSVRLKELFGKRNRWRIFPRIRYTNFRKEYPEHHMEQVFGQWFSVRRYWSGRIINVTVKWHQLTLDFRLDAMADLLGPNA